MTQIIDKSGRAHEIDLSLADYRAAYDQGLTFAQYLNGKVEMDVDSAEKFGTPFEQALASNNLFRSYNKHTGIRPPTMKQVLQGDVDVNLGTIVRPDGSAAQTVAGRLLFPALIIEMVESQISEDNSSYEGIFNQLVATTTNSDSPRMDQPIINLTAPRAKRSQPVAQGALPPNMVTISLSEKSYRLPSYAIGLEITDEAQKSTALDLVGIALREQGAAERAAMVDEGLTQMIDGDTDLGMSALSSELVTAYDSTISAAATMTQKAWIKWLRKDWKKLNIDWVICDIDSYLSIEGRSNRPVVVGNEGTDARLNVIPRIANSGLPDSVNFFIVDTAVIGANTLVGIDSTRAIRKAVYTGAAYSAIEEFVLRRTSALRIDFSLAYFRLLDGAWKKMTMTTS